ncbi:Uncharacterised protein [Bacteroides thetaiotaomicron]|jgi:hypothetical protein|uniref:hypothetical protein n=1 Tax=Bacteroides thetaiotaomicron TaxID=818 RepID=UPI0006C51CF3|nr:hypothetical protein [Bacteroides thetaiotaomicron]CUN27717.1 Uncharacterised protein [Bacteroides thetaiotaomicron]
MDVQFKRTINTEEARSYMKLAVTTESKDRLKYYLDLLGYHHITYKVEKIKLMGDTFSEVCVLPHHYKVARNMWRQTIEAVLDETEIFTD